MTDTRRGRFLARNRHIPVCYPSPDLKEHALPTRYALNREWSPTDYPGIERSLLRQNDTNGRTSLVRLRAGGRNPTVAPP